MPGLGCFRYALLVVESQRNQLGQNDQQHQRHKVGGERNGRRQIRVPNLGYDTFRTVGVMVVVVEHKVMDTHR